MAPLSTTRHSPEPRSPRLSSPSWIEFEQVQARTRRAQIPVDGSASATPLLGALMPVLALAYLCALLWMYRFAKEHPRTLNKCAGTKVQKYAPGVYALEVLLGLVGTALTIWLLVQYPFLHEIPSGQARASIGLLLFTSIWTTLTSAAYSFAFLHPTYSTHPICSIGSQLLWIVVSWILWVAGAASLGNGVPYLVPPPGNSGDETCGGASGGSALGVQVCSVERGVYGLAIIQIILLTAYFLIIAWLARETLSQELRPLSYAPTIRSQPNHSQSFRFPGHFASFANSFNATSRPRQGVNASRADSPSAWQRIQEILGGLLAPLGSMSAWWRQAA